jgi:hypothetical protein
MKVGSVKSLAIGLVGVLVLAGSWSARTRAQEGRPHAQHHEWTSDQKTQAGALLKTVREATARFHDVAVAEQEGYRLMFGCVSGPDYGAMGLHYVKMPLVVDGKVDPTEPEIVIYEPLPNGKLRLTGADFLVFKADWDADPSHEGRAPEILGQLFHQFDSPNRFGLPAFYTLHVWAWKENPAGTFSNWHAKVSCDAFSAQ